MIRLENVSKAYKDKHIFKRAFFEAEASEITLLMGKSGIGKSTFLDIIAGIKTYDRGRYLYQGKKLSPEDDEMMSRFRSQHIGYVLQDFALIDDDTVLENILLPTRYHPNIKKIDMLEKAKMLAEQFELTETLNKKAKLISGGQKQRVALVRSLILEPQLILADEPTANLDADNFQLVMATFLEQKKQGKTIIIATHDERILSIADRVYKIEKFELLRQL